jgi:hypothetical protein
MWIAGMGMAKKEVFYDDDNVRFCWLDLTKQKSEPRVCV